VRDRREGAHRAAGPGFGDPTSADAGPETQPSPEAHPDPLEPLAAHREPSSVGAFEAVLTAEETRPAVDTEAPAQVPPGPAQPVVVPGQYHYLKRWSFVLVLAAVWIPAAAIGAALYYEWYHSIDKTLSVFLALVVIVVCTVAGLLLAMVERKPLVAAVAIAVMSAPFASTAAAAALYGAYVFGWIAR
jgi:hypothetical protein